MCCISGMPCWSLVPIVQPPPWTWSSTGAFSSVAVGRAGRCRAGRAGRRRCSGRPSRPGRRGSRHPERVDQLAPRRRQVGRGGLRVELLEVVDAEALDQGVLGLVLDLAALPRSGRPARRRWRRPAPARPGRARRPRRRARRRRPRSARAGAARARWSASRRRTPGRRRGSRAAGRIALAVRAAVTSWRRRKDMC